VCEVICRKDTAKSIERTILPRLTNGLEVVKLIPLCISVNTDDGELVCKYNRTPSIGSAIPMVDVYVTGNLAFQAMALGKESMAGHWCMQCTSSKAQFLDDGTMWTMEEMVRLGKEAEHKKGKLQLGIKQQPWWPFIPISNYMVPLLHCEIGIGNQLLDKLHDIMNKHIKQYGPTEELMQSSIPVLKNIISQTVMLRDAWDASADGKQLKALTRTVAAYRPCQGGGDIIADARDRVANNDVDKQGQTHALEKTQL
jgi:hypothetical protein